MDESPWTAVTSDLLGLTAGRVEAPPETAAAAVAGSGSASLLIPTRGKRPRPGKKPNRVRGPPEDGSPAGFPPPRSRSEGKSLLKSHHPAAAPASKSGATDALSAYLSLDRLAADAGLSGGMGFGPVR